MGTSSSKQVETSKGKGKSTDQSFSEVTEHRDRAIRSVQSLRAQFRCECSHPQCPEVSPPPDYDKIFYNWLAGSQTVPPTSQFSIWSCKEGHSTCVGCGAAPKFSSESIFTSLGVVNHCCDGARQFTIWFLLAQFDSLCLEAEATSENDSKAVTKAKAKAKSKAKPGVPGVGYGTDFGGMGGGWSDDEIFMTQHMMVATGHAASLSSAIEKNQDILEQNASQDDLLMDTVKILGACLPDTDSDTTIEMDLFRLSILFDKITQLIRNDSIVDITERLGVYQATAKFVTKIANHPGLVQLLFEERPNKTNTPGLGELSLPSYISSHTLDDASASKPLVACYGDTYLQVRTFLKMLRNPKTTIKIANTRRSKESDRLLQDLVRCFETLDAAVSKSTYPLTDAQPENAWLDFADDNKVTFTDDVLLHHRYTNNFKTIQTSNRGRLTTISKEIATLQTSLPYGIFLKVAESRSDVMKVLIIGPEGTPYAGGLFIFDMFLDERYPATPPKMTFTLHGNDEDGESFNPNLHLHSGTVCLSLLNTWPGEASQSWQPHKSTILSVLVSIQAMVLGAPMPWENEPGFEGSGATPRNLSHKARVESRTLRFAIIAWLENKFADPQSKEHIWKEISQKYYQHNSEKVLGYVREWVAENPGLLNFGPTDYWLVHVKGIRPKLPPGSSEQNLVERLSTLLGVAYDPAAFPTVEIRIKESRVKRKPSTTKNPPGSSKKHKASDSMPKWIYWRDKSQKMVKKACKDFGIGYNNTIKASIEKLEAHINALILAGEGDEDLMMEWGEWVVNPSDSDQELEDTVDAYYSHQLALAKQQVKEMTGSSHKMDQIGPMGPGHPSLFGPSKNSGSKAQTFPGPGYGAPSSHYGPMPSLSPSPYPVDGSSGSSENTIKLSGKQSHSGNGSPPPAPKSNGKGVTKAIQDSTTFDA
ncbi:hypothetical protein VTL71DRAFT_15289 [Oculimacula yallundae]|uniref:UBC core domain-containing protein n=1 Tax=Oculimacula yallundae TaxID=86028 RepID=A0ABR4CG46_9HELO